MSPEYCPNIEQKLPKYCPNITKLLPKYYTNIVQVLPKYCADTHFSGHTVCVFVNLLQHKIARLH